MVSLADVQTHQPQPLSMAMEVYLDHTLENDPDRHLGFDTARVRRFEHHLKEMNLSLRSLPPAAVRAYLERIRLTEGEECALGHETTLREFFKALTIRNLIPVNPLPDERRSQSAPMETRGFSEELVTFVTHQEATGCMEHLPFDVPRIQVWEAFLARRNKNIRSAEDADLTEFMRMAQQRFTPKQACGLALTIPELYLVMQESGLMENIPHSREVVRVRTMLERVLQNDSSTPMPRHGRTGSRHLRRTRTGRRLWITVMLVLLVVGVSGVLAWQLVFNRSSSQPLQSGTWRTTVKEVKNALQGSTTSIATTTSSTTTSMASTTTSTATTTSTSSTTTTSMATTTTSVPPPVKPPVETPPLPARMLGCVAGNCIDGVGTYIHDDGARFTGTWVKGKKHGPGEVRFSSGGGYRGVWQNDKLTKVQ